MALSVIFVKTTWPIVFYRNGIVDFYLNKSSLSLLRTKNVCNSLFSVSISHRKPLSSPSFQHKSLELFRKVKLNSAFSLSQKRCSQNAEMIHQYRQDYSTRELLLSRCLYKTILSFMTCPGYTETNT